jgi:hypothetical protein
VADKKPWFVHAFELLYDGWNFAQFVGAFGLGAAASYVHLEGNTPLAPWLLVIASALIGWGLVRITREAVKWIRVVIDRPSAVLEIESGTTKPLIEIAHYGAPVTYSAEGRITRSLDSASEVKPPQGRFACELQPREGRPNAQSVTLADGEWVHIVLADFVQFENEDRKHLCIRRGTYGKRAIVEDSGVEVEIIIKAVPHWPIRAILRRILITRDGNSIKAVAVGD